MVESVIVTVTDSAKRIGYDMELPANMPAKELSNNLLAALKGAKPGDFARYSSLKINIGSRVLQDEETLAQAGVWDGSIITITG